MKTPNSADRKVRETNTFLYSVSYDLMRKSFDLFFTPGRFYILIFIIPLFLSNGYLNAQEQKKKKIKSAEIKLSLASIYDSNILKYSEKYSNKFINQEDEGRFHISSYDGFVLYNSIQTAINFHLLKNRKSKLSFTYSRRTYINNSIKSWNYFNVGLLQNINKRVKFNLNYSYIPEFYIRHFRDYDWVENYGYVPETFQAFSFSKENFGIWIQGLFFSDTRFRLSFSNDKYYYNQHFTEYDSNNFLYGIKVYQPIYKKFKLTLGGQFITSNTKDLDKTIYISDYSDASYKEAEFLFGLQWKLPDLKRFNNKLNINCNYQKRYYSSKNLLETDPLHVGRVDDKINFSVEYNLKIHKNLEVSAYYKRFQRFLNNSAEINREFLTEERNYHQYLIGMQLTYNLKIKNKNNYKTGH